MVNIEQSAWRKQGIFASIIAMLTALLISRIFLSISVSVFLLLTCVHAGFISQLKTFFKTPLLIAISLLFFIPLVSGLWSSDTNEWLNVLRVKLGFILLPIAFAGSWQLSSKQWRQIAFAFLIAVAIACCWSIADYLQDMNAINDEYLKAQTIPTPLNDDHVRFSWLVSIAAILATMLWTSTRHRTTQILLILGWLLFAVYLHILSARTGLLILYVFTICFLVYSLRARAQQAIWVVITLLMVAVASWSLLPTLKNRVRYNLYDLQLVNSGEYHSGMSDANRIISLKAGWQLLKENPFGLGAGDVLPAINNWYDSNMPAMHEWDRIYPSSEWFVYGLFAGWPGIVLFSLVMLYPLFIKNIANRFFWVMMTASAGLSFVIETSLERQHGVFIYAFVLLWWWKWLTFEKQVTLKHD